MKKHIVLLFIAVLAQSCFLSSCDDFLDVTPEDKITGDQAFQTEFGINAVLNGIYLDLGQNNLYGNTLTMLPFDVMAQYYYLSDSHGLSFQLSQYAYGQSEVENHFTALWSAAYKSILSVNEFMKNAEKTQGVLSQDKKDILMGESYGLRAMLHFDLFKVFGPVYADNPGQISIPYYTVPDARPEPLLPANAVVDSILLDLSRAERLLQKDPIIREGVNVYMDNDPLIDFYKYRNRRMNYFAVKLLQARINLYVGNKQAALEAAKEVIDAKAGGVLPIFPWTPYSDLSRVKCPDLVFSTEIVFGVHNTNMYNNHDNYFSGALMDGQIIAPMEDNLKAVFENNENDTRYTTTWVIPTEYGKTTRTFHKYKRPVARSVADTLRFEYFQPVLRYSEAYYIAAETEPDKQVALQYLNKVRVNRGLTELSDNIDINTELMKEYRKEFIGEGQMFFYYKRRVTTSIRTGSAGSGTINMGNAQYVVPLPREETNYQ